MSDSTRNEALRASIATFLLDMSESELDQVDAFVMDLRTERDRWARHVDDPRWHHIVEYGSSVVTACRGRWPIDDAFETEARPASADRCALCQERFVATRLAASPAAPVVEGSNPDAATISYDLGGEG